MVHKGVMRCDRVRCLDRGCDVTVECGYGTPEKSSERESCRVQVSVRVLRASERWTPHQSAHPIFWGDGRGLFERGRRGSSRVGRQRYRCIAPQSRGSPGRQGSDVERVASLGPDGEGPTFLRRVSRATRQQAASCHRWSSARLGTRRRRAAHQAEPLGNHSSERAAAAAGAAAGISLWRCICIDIFFRSSRLGTTREQASSVLSPRAEAVGAVRGARFVRRGAGARRKAQGRRRRR